MNITECKKRDLKQLFLLQNNPNHRLICTQRKHRSAWVWMMLDVTRNLKGCQSVPQKNATQNMASDQILTCFYLVHSSERKREL